MATTNQSTEMVVIIRPSFKKFCQDGCRAAAFNHALYWIAQKNKGYPVEKVQSGEITWYATTEEFAEGLANAWCACKVRKEVNKLLAMGLLGRGKNPRWGAGRTKYFCFGIEQCAILLQYCQQHGICLLHLGLSDAVLQLLRATTTNDKSIVCNCPQTIDLSHTNDKSIETQTIDLSHTNDKSIASITKESSKDTTKDSNKERKSVDPSQAKEIPPSPSVSPIIFSLEEQRILDWFCEREAEPVDMLLAKKRCAAISVDIKTREQFQELHAIAAKKVQGKENSRPNLGNMVSALPVWRNAHMQTEDQWWVTSRSSESIEHEEVRQEPTTDEMPVVLPELPRQRSRGMNLGATENLEEEIDKAGIGLIGQRGEISPGCYVLYVWYGDEEWFALDLVAWWHLPEDPKLQRLIEEAARYAASFDATAPLAESEVTRECSMAL